MGATREAGDMVLGEVRNVRKEFAPERKARAADTIVALEDASFDFAAGEFVSFLGPSGCGKTTLLRIIAGLISKTSGSVKIGGAEVVRPSGNYGFVFQAPSLMPWRSVIDNVLFPMEVLRKVDRAARARAAHLLEITGLTDFRRSRPHQLSGGMQQRVSLCRALIHQPPLLLMDEPFGALDELTRLDMNDMLLRVRSETGASVLFVTHSISEAIYLSDKVLVFSRRPARVAREMSIDLPKVRTQALRFGDRFKNLEREASVALGVLGPEDQPGVAGSIT
jgi:NitT/TauT family transport system ATP-binding protein